MSDQRLGQWIRREDRRFSECITQLQLTKLLLPARNGRGVTLLWPDATSRANIIDLANGSEAEAEKAETMIRALIIPDLFRAAADFTLRPVGSKNRVAYAVTRRGDTLQLAGARPTPQPAAAASAPHAAPATRPRPADDDLFIFDEDGLEPVPAPRPPTPPKEKEKEEEEVEPAEMSEPEPEPPRAPTPVLPEYLTISPMQETNNLRDNLAVWAIDGIPPLEGPSYTVPTEASARAAAGGAAEPPAPNRPAAIMKQRVELVDKCLNHKDMPAVAAKRVVSLMNFLREEFPEAYAAALMLVDPHPFVTLVLLLEAWRPAATAALEADPLVVPDEAVRLWKMSRQCVQPWVEYAELLGAAASAVGDRAKAEAARQKAAEIPEGRVAGAKAVRGAYGKLAAGKFPGCAGAAAAMATMGQHTVAGDSDHAPRWPGDRRLWQDALRFELHVYLKRPRLPRKEIHYAIANLFPGHSWAEARVFYFAFDKEMSMGAMADDVAERFQQWLTSGAFLYLPSEAAGMVAEKAEAERGAAKPGLSKRTLRELKHHRKRGGVMPEFD